MGADIHMRVETKTPDGWEMVGEIFDSWWREGGKTFEPWEGRNYDLFAMLADVRNGYGFAGVPTGVGFRPIAAPRGIPEDASSDGAEFMESYETDGHSHSYHTLRQLREYDWDGQTTMSCGVVSGDAFEKLRASGESPDSYAGGISGAGIVTFSEDGYDSWVAAGRPDPGTDPDPWSRPRTHRHGVDTVGVIERPVHAGPVKPYVRMTWTVSYREAAGEAWFATMDRLAELIPAGGSEDDVRIVFFFDN